MKLETRFDLNQYAWAIDNTNLNERVISECSICNRTGKVTLKGESLTCPKCSGRSVVPQWHIAVSCGTVVQVSIRRTIASLAHGYDNETSYMLGTVGSGRIWPESFLFTGEQEAQAECDRLNRKLSK